MENCSNFDEALNELYANENQWEMDILDDYEYPKKQAKFDSFEKFLKEVKKTVPLSEKRLVELVQAKNAGDASAIQEIVESNLRLVLYYASKYAQTREELEDYFQEGCIGLIRAANNFSLEKGCHFSTYATYWIIEMIQRARAANEKIVHIPLYALFFLKKILRTQDEYYKTHGTNATVEELSHVLGISAERITHLLTFEKLYSLDRIVSTEEFDESSTLIQFIPSPEEATEELVISHLDDSCFDDARKILNEREFLILSYHFGHEIAKPMTFAQIGRLLNLSRERVRQIQEKALKKLRKNKRFIKKYCIGEQSSH